MTAAGAPDNWPPKTRPATLARATTNLPAWLADQVATWVNEHEDRGWRHTTADVAVRCALEEIGARQ